MKRLAIVAIAALALSACSMVPPELLDQMEEEGVPLPLIVQMTSIW